MNIDESKPFTRGSTRRAHRGVLRDGGELGIVLQFEGDLGRTYHRAQDEAYSVIGPPLSGTDEGRKEEGLTIVTQTRRGQA